MTGERGADILYRPNILIKETVCDPKGRVASEIVDNSYGLINL